jgi:hypothetical protein
MKITDPDTHQVEELCETEQFDKDLTSAVLASGLTDYKQMKRYWKWYSKQYIRLHVRKSRFDGNISEGTNIKKMVKYLDDKVTDKYYIANCAHAFISLQSTGFISNDEYERFFLVVCDIETKRVATGIQVIDHSTQNFKDLREPICRILDDDESARLMNTFINKPWPHATSASNKVLWDILVLKIHRLAENETGLKIKSLFLRKKSNYRGNALEVRMSNGYLPISEPKPAMPLATEFGRSGETLVPGGHESMRISRHEENARVSCKVEGGGGNRRIILRQDSSLSIASLNADNLARKAFLERVFIICISCGIPQFRGKPILRISGCILLDNAFSLGGLLRYS